MIVFDYMFLNKTIETQLVCKQSLLLINQYICRKDLLKTKVLTEATKMKLDVFHFGTNIYLEF